MSVFKLEEISFAEVEKLDREKTIVVMTLGSMEQHGPHLPIGMDIHIASDIAKVVADRKKDEIDLLILPSIPIGQSPEHMDFPGTLTFTAETFIRMIKEIAASISRHGFKKLLIVNGHGGNIAAIGAAAFDIRDQYKIKVFMFNVWSLVVDLATKLTNREASNRTDAHGGEIETSLIMYLYPNQINMDLAIDEKNEQLADSETIGMAGPIQINWNSIDDIAPSGISGIPSFGTPEKGKVIFDALCDIATKGIDEINLKW